MCKLRHRDPIMAAYMCSVNPIYYVFFTTATIVASAILFQGFNTTGGVNTLSLICGFLIIFMGVYLLNISRQPEVPHHASSLESGLMSKSTSPVCWRCSMRGGGDARNLILQIPACPCQDAYRWNPTARHYGTTPRYLPPAWAEMGSCNHRPTDGDRASIAHRAVRCSRHLRRTGWR
jgi:hypothetical protein